MSIINSFIINTQEITNFVNRMGVKVIKKDDFGEKSTTLCIRQLRQQRDLLNVALRERLVCNKRVKVK